MQKVKTGLDSAFKQVMREYRPAFLSGAGWQITECRYVAGNYAYICLTGKLGQSPHKTTGGALKSAAGKTQCVRKIATRRGSALQYSASIGYMPGRVREVRRNAEM
ncbi:hypothetical protein G6L68_08020 [Agrobacterium fabrum]|nr:hypothetical protein [Agrobacterium fabrum]